MSSGTPKNTVLKVSPEVLKALSAHPDKPRGLTEEQKHVIWWYAPIKSFPAVCAALGVSRHAAETYYKKRMKVEGISKDDHIAAAWERYEKEQA